MFSLLPIQPKGPLGFFVAYTMYATIFVMRKKTTLKEVGEMLTHVVKHMATKEDVREIVKKELKPIETRLAAVEGKVSGIDRRLDAEAMRRDDEKIPARVATIEKKVFGASQAPIRR